MNYGGSPYSTTAPCTPWSTPAPGLVLPFAIVELIRILVDALPVLFQNHDRLAVILVGCSTSSGGLKLQNKRFGGCRPWDLDTGPYTPGRPESLCVIVKWSPSWSARRKLPISRKRSPKSMCVARWLHCCAATLCPAVVVEVVETSGGISWVLVQELIFKLPKYGNPILYDGDAWNPWFKNKLPNSYRQAVRKLQGGCRKLRRRYRKAREGSRRSLDQLDKSCAKTAQKPRKLALALLSLSLSFSRSFSLSLSFFRQGYGEEEFPLRSLSLSLPVSLPTSRFPALSRSFLRPNAQGFQTRPTNPTFRPAPCSGVHFKPGASACLSCSFLAFL